MGPKPVYEKPCKLHLQLSCCLPLRENTATCLTLMTTWLSALLLGPSSTHSVLGSTVSSVRSFLHPASPVEPLRYTTYGE